MGSLSDDIYATLRVDGRLVGKTDSRQISKDCWEQEFSFELDKVCNRQKSITKHCVCRTANSKSTCTGTIDAVCVPSPPSSWATSSTRTSHQARQFCRSNPAANYSSASAISTRSLAESRSCSDRSVSSTKNVRRLILITHTKALQKPTTTGQKALAARWVHARGVV